MIVNPLHAWFCCVSENYIMHKYTYPDVDIKRNASTEPTIPSDFDKEVKNMTVKEPSIET